MSREAAGRSPDREPWHRFPLPGRDVSLTVQARGSGEPVVMVSTALTADELVPAASQPVLADAFTVVHYHRRGYAGSSPAGRPGSIRRDAEDCLALLDAVGMDRAHLVGVSFSAAVAMQAAVDAPARVGSLTLIEPPPAHTPSSAEFAAANRSLQQAYARDGVRAALDGFLSHLMGREWRRDLERWLPGSVQQVKQDAPAFFESDIPALLDWQLTAQDAAAISAPVLYVGGSDSGPWFEQVHRHVLDWLPQTEDVVVDGADHSLALTHAPQVAEALAAFLGRHPLDSGSPGWDATSGPRPHHAPGNAGSLPV